jgi:hypothetical protein
MTDWETMTAHLVHPVSIEINDDAIFSDVVLTLLDGFAIEVSGRYSGVTAFCVEGIVRSRDSTDLHLNLEDIDSENVTLIRWEDIEQIVYL